MRGESNVQGSTDFGLLYDNLTGYLGAPKATFLSMQHLQAIWQKKHLKQAIWSNKPKFVVSLLKAWYGTKCNKG